MRYRSARNDAGLAPVQIALIAASSALAVLVVLAIVFLSGGGSGGGTPTPSGSMSPTSGASPTTTSAPTSWAEVPEQDRPPFLAGRAGEPPAREWAPWVLDLVDDTWDADIWCDPNPNSNLEWPEEQASDRCLYQALYLEAPDGERLRVYTLRTDVLLGIEATALDEGIVWIARYYYESEQTVQFDLATGTADENWAHDGFTNVTAPSSQQGWFVLHVTTLPNGRMVWEGAGYGEPLHGVFFREPGGILTPSSISPAFGGAAGEPYCLGVDPAQGVGIYESYTFAEGEPVANWPAKLVVHDLTTDTYNVISRLGPYGDPCFEGFEVTATYYVGFANRVDQSGIFRYYFDGSPDQAVP